MLMSFLTNFLDFCRAYQELFLNRSDFNASLKSHAREGFEKFTKDLFGSFFSIVRKRLVKEQDTKAVINSLEVLHRHLLNIHSQVPEPCILDRATAIVTVVIDNKIENTFDHLQMNVIEHVKSLEDKITSRKTETPNETIKSLAEATNKTITT